MQPDPDVIREHLGVRRIFMLFIDVISPALYPFISLFRWLTSITFTRQPPTDSTLSFLIRKMSSLPIFTKKYNLVLRLANRKIKLSESDPKLKKCTSDVLSEAFQSTISSFENIIEAAANAATAGKWTLWLRRKTTAAQAGSTCTWRLAEEAVWVAQKMKDCGDAFTVVKIWGSASKLSKLAMSVDPSSHHQLVSVCVFILELANSEELDKVVDAQKCRLSILKTWLPFLCRTNYKLHAPIKNFKEEVAVVPILENLIGKLTDEGKEEVLRLWLDH